MAKKIDPSLKTNNDTGFGSNPNSYGGRFINKDGTFNLRREGISFLNRFSLYQRMLNLPRWKFAGIILLFYFTMNLLFTLAYLIVGTDQLQGIIAATPWSAFKETCLQAFYHLLLPPVLFSEGLQNLSHTSHLAIMH
jgi:inward rectifier potassium channel